MYQHSDNIEFKFAVNGDKAGSFTGYGSVFGNVDSHGDVIEAGAFKDSLKYWQAKGQWPKMLLQHGGFSASDGIPIGVYTDMREDAKGLAVEGYIDPIDTDEGKKIYAGLKNNTLDGLSIGYKAVQFEMGTKAGDPRRVLKKVDLFEVSIVTFGSNPKSTVSQVKSYLSSLTSEECRELEAILRTKELSRADAAKAVSGFKEWLRRDAEAPSVEPRDESKTAKSLLDALRGVNAAISK